MKPCLPLVLALGALLAQPAAAAPDAGGTAATVIRATALKQKPALESADVATLAADTPVRVTASQGGWNQVRTDAGQQGWLRMFALRPEQPQAAAPAGQSSLSSLGGVLRSGSSGAVATTAAKGLDPQALQNASPNMAELARLDNQGVPAATAQRHARDNRIASTTVAWPGSSQQGGAQ